MRLMISGALYTDPQQKISRNDNPYVTAMVRDSSTNPATMASLIAFGDIADSLLKCVKGDSVTVSGNTTLGLYSPDGREPRIQINVTVEQIITLKKQKPAVRPEANTGKPPTPEINSARVSTPEPETKAQKIISNETLKAAKDERAKKNAPIPTGICPTCNQPFDTAGGCSCPF